MPAWSHVPTWPDMDRDTDRLVLRDRIVVGRVHLTITAHDGEKWSWAVQTLPASHGYADTLAKALEQVRAGASDRFSTKPQRR